MKNNNVISTDRFLKSVNKEETKIESKNDKQKVTEISGERYSCIPDYIKEYKAYMEKTGPGKGKDYRFRRYIDIINKADLNSQEEFILAVTKASMKLMRDTAEDKQAKSPDYWKNIFFSAADAYRYLEDIFDYDDSLRDAYSVNFNGISFLGQVAIDTIKSARTLSAYEYYLSLREKNERLFGMLESFCRNVQYYGLYVCILDEEGYPCFEPPVSPEEEKGFYICDKGKDGSYRFVEDYANYQIKSEMGSYIREAAEYGSFFHVFCMDPGSKGYSIFKAGPEGISFVDEEDLLCVSEDGERLTDLIKEETMFADIEEYMNDCVFAGDIPEIFE